MNAAAAGAAQRLRRDARIARRNEIVAVLRGGLRWECTAFQVVYLPNGCGHHRLGVLVSRRNGGAVERNRAKRVFREVFRTSRQDRAPYLDVIVRPRGVVCRGQGEIRWEFLRWKEAAAQPCLGSSSSSSAQQRH